jgi:hypothetical protein
MDIELLNAPQVTIPQILHIWAQILVKRGESLSFDGPWLQAGMNRSDGQTFPFDVVLGLNVFNH